MGYHLESVSFGTFHYNGATQANAFGLYQTYASLSQFIGWLMITIGQADLIPFPFRPY